MADHTPGPWKTDYEKISPTSFAQLIRGADGEVVAQMGWAQRPLGKGRVGTWREENAYLCAAAPDLLSALINVRARFQHYRHGPDEEMVMNRVDAAIKKAQNKETA